MKKIGKYYMLLLILSGWLALSIIGFVNKDTLYRAYTIDEKTTPYFALVLSGIKDGIYPWSEEEKPIWEAWEEQTKEQEELLEDGLPIADIGEAGDENYVRPTISIDSPVIHSPYVWNEFDSPFASNRGFVQVEESYFSNAVFIGDSRTVGLKMYGNIGATFHASDGMNIYNLWTEKFCEVNGKKVTLEEALSVQEFEKVYIQIGINEISWGTADGFAAAYAQTVEKIKELQPKAVIFVQGIMRVTKEKSESDAVYSNERINLRNEKLSELADRKRVFYIDINEALCDEEGHLNSDYTYDEFHLLASKYVLWVAYLMEHGV